MNTTNRKIYLCGPIMDCAGNESKDWRTRAKERLAGRFILLDPMRRNFRDREIDSANEIVEFDLQDIRDADLVLVNYSKASVGTSTMVEPPSAGSTAPVTIDASSEARKRQTAAISSGRAGRRSGTSQVATA